MFSSKDLIHAISFPGKFQRWLSICSFACVCVQMHINMSPHALCKMLDLRPLEVVCSSLGVFFSSIRVIMTNNSFRQSLATLRKHIVFVPLYICKANQTECYTCFPVTCSYYSDWHFLYCVKIWKKITYSRQNQIRLSPQVISANTASFLVLQPLFLKMLALLNKSLFKNVISKSFIVGVFHHHVSSIPKCGHFFWKLFHKLW